MEKTPLQDIYDSSREELVRELHESLALDVTKGYRKMRSVMRRYAEQQTRFTHLQHPTLFAKVNYLLGQMEASRDLRRRVNEARVRMGDPLPAPPLGESLSNEEIRLIERHRLEDVRALEEFIMGSSATPSAPTGHLPLYGEACGREEGEKHTGEPDGLPIKGEVAHSAGGGSGAGGGNRLIVTAFTETTITGRLDDGEGTLVTAVYGPDNPWLYGRDWSYLQKALRVGAQINIIRCHQGEEGVLLPELFIVEPDILIDITTVASCIEDYSESPLVHLMSRLHSDGASSAILLGNLASQLLDETLRGVKRPYTESARDFFRANPLLLATTPTDTSFHADAQQQADNIRQAVEKGLKSHFANFSPADTVLEPTFFCETLGLQGRMDMLQLDYRILVEQKSGKGGWPPNQDPQIPVAQQKHYAQVLLYMAILHYGFGIDNGQIAPFLLYSKYSKGLLGMGPAPTLLHTALRIRNQLARCEQMYAEEGYEILLRLRPEHLLKKGGGGRLWEIYKRPVVEHLLSVVQKASPLEQAYFLRYMRFVSTEHMLGKVGNMQKESSGFAAKWHDTLDDKLLAGNIYADLHLVTPASATEENVAEVVLEILTTDNGQQTTDNRQQTTENGEQTTDNGQQTTENGEQITDNRQQTTENCQLSSLNSQLSTVNSQLSTLNSQLSTLNSQLSTLNSQLPSNNFRPGDIVVLYPYAPGTEPDIRRTPCLRGSLAEISNRRLTVRLRAPQSTARFFFASGEERVWAIEHDFMESSSAGLFRGLHAFLKAPKERRDLVLSQRRPEVDESLVLRGDYGAFNELALRVRQARDLFLIIGPPGTGKTSFGLMTTLREELLTPDANVLLLSYTNRAVDEACSKFLEAGLDFIRLGNGLSCAEACRPYLLEERVAGLQNIAEIQELIGRTRLFAATTASLCSHQELFRLKRFTLAIVDEASQILEPQILPLIAAQTPDVEPAIRKFVLIGDHKQLPAVVQQSEEQARVESPLLREIGLTDCRGSLFERLLRTYRDDPAVVYMLTAQGRMHPEVAAFPNAAFYEGKLHPVPLPHQQAHSDGARVEFIDAPLPEDSPSDKVNAVEADIVARLIMDNGWTDEVGVIVPYRNQIAAIRSLLPEEVARRVTIDTVERFQGSQRRIIIYSFTVQQRYQLRFLTAHTFEEDGHLIDRKLNVAMTRAMDRLILVGHAPLLRQAPVFKELIEMASPRPLKVGISVGRDKS